MMSWLRSHGRDLAADCSSLTSRALFKISSACQKRLWSHRKVSKPGDCTLLTADQVQPREEIWPLVHLVLYGIVSVSIV